MKQRMWFYLVAFLASLVVTSFVREILIGHSGPEIPMTSFRLMTGIVIHGMFLHYVVLMYRRAKLTSSKL